MTKLLKTLVCPKGALCWGTAIPQPQVPCPGARTEKNPPWWEDGRTVKQLRCELAAAKKLGSCCSLSETGT